MSQAYIAYLHNAGLDDDHVVVKIGFSNNPARRFRQMAAMSWIGPKWIEASTKNTATAGSEIELFLHNFLRLHRIHHEWFHVPREELAKAKNAVWSKFGECFVLDDISDEDEEDAARDVMARRLGA
jgi:hypothetical protein